MYILLLDLPLKYNNLYSIYFPWGGGGGGGGGICDFNQLRNSSEKNWHNDLDG